MSGVKKALRTFWNPPSLSLMLLAISHLFLLFFLFIFKQLRYTPHATLNKQVQLSFTAEIGIFLIRKWWFSDLKWLKQRQRVCHKRPQQELLYSGTDDVREYSAIKPNATGTVFLGLKRSISSLIGVEWVCCCCQGVGETAWCHWLCLVRACVRRSSLVLCSEIIS